MILKKGEKILTVQQDAPREGDAFKILIKRGTTGSWWIKKPGATHEEPKTSNGS